MADADLLADRRRLRRKLSFWRIATFVIVIAGLIGVGVLARRGFESGSPHVARIAMKGFIAGDDATLKLIERVRDNDSVKAVLVHIESPGGTTSGAEAIHEALTKLKAKKPVVAVVDGMAASGGYIAAIASDRIVARETALVGSIGVLFQYPNVAGLLETVGVKMESVKSSPLKASPNGFEPTPPEARAALESLIADSFAWFKRLVQSGRSMSDAELAAVSDGRVFTGRQAVSLKLVDELGGEDKAIDWLKAQNRIEGTLPVRDWRPRREGTGLTLWSAAGAAADAFGLPQVGDAIRRAAQADAGARLDGLLAVWHPPLEK